MSSTPTPTITFNLLHPAAAAVDLTKVRRRVLREHPSWTEARADAAVEEYRRFATLAARGVSMPPCLDVDEIWHAHILHTIDYAAFSRALLGPGGFMHHVPADPEDTPAEQRGAMSEAYAEGLRAYRAAFGEDPPAMWGNEMSPDADADCAALFKDDDCGGASKEGFCAVLFKEADLAGAKHALCLKPPAANQADTGLALCMYWDPSTRAGKGAFCVTGDLSGAAPCLKPPAKSAGKAFCARGGLCAPKPAVQDTGQAALCWGIIESLAGGKQQQAKIGRGAALCLKPPAEATGQALCASVGSPALSKAGRQALCASVGRAALCQIACRMSISASA